LNALRFQRVVWAEELKIYQIDFYISAVNVIRECSSTC